MIIAVDYDGTLVSKNGEINAPLLNRLAASQRRGDTVILWTCREGKSLHEAVSILRRIGFRPNYINQNAPEAIRRLGRDSRKIYADLYIDDKGAVM